MSNFSLWPTCAECTNRRRANGNPDPWSPVEEYSIDPAKRSSILQVRYSIRVVVEAACSHGHGFRGDYVRRQSSEPIDCPWWWNVDPENPFASKYLQAAVQSLVFFKPGGEKPAHRMVVQVT